MCLELRGLTERPIPKKAKKDIWVYKAINKNGTGWIFNLKIDGKIERWKKGYHYVETTPFIDMFYYRDVAKIEGNCFHSTGSKKYAKSMCTVDEEVVRMYIPKGALYYHTKEDSLYASSELVFPERKNKKK